MPRIVDLSMTTESDPSPLMNVTITHLDHENGALEDQKYYDIDPADWPHPGKSYADDFVEMTTHAGTHMDAPIHMGPEMKDGSKPKTIDEWPLNRCMGPGVVLDIRNIPQAHEVSPSEVRQMLADIDHELTAGDIVLVMTGNDKYWGTPEYLDRGGHLGAGALRWILEQGVAVVGTDSWSFDRPYSQWSADYHAHGRDPKYLWPCHLLGMEIEYAHIEKMANLDQLPPHGFTVIAFPVKISGGTAGFCRAVALVDD
jgi:kynurenine formamidase